MSLPNWVGWMATRFGSSFAFSEGTPLPVGRSLQNALRPYPTQLGHKPSLRSTQFGEHPARSRLCLLTWQTRLVVGSSPACLGRVAILPVSLILSTRLVGSG